MVTYRGPWTWSTDGAPTSSPRYRTQLSGNCKLCGQPAFRQIRI